MLYLLETVFAPAWVWLIFLRSAVAQRADRRHHPDRRAGGAFAVATRRGAPAQGGEPRCGTQRSRARRSVDRMISTRDRLDEILARLAAGAGERVFLKLYADAARAAADAADVRRKAGSPLGPLDGAIVSVKDLFDVAGEATLAGSKLLADAQPAERDAPQFDSKVARGGCNPGRQDQHDRVRVFGTGAQSALRHAAQSLRSRDRTRSRRLIVRRSSVRRRRHGGGWNWHRHGRVGAHPGGGLRAGRIQAHGAPRAARRCVSPVPHARFDRSAGPHGCAMRGGRRGDGGRGSRSCAWRSLVRPACRYPARKTAGRSRADVATAFAHSLKRRGGRCPHLRPSDR